MAKTVDNLIPANAQAAVKALGLVVSRSVIDGARVRGIPYEVAEITVACLHDYGFVARMVEPRTASDKQMTGRITSRLYQTRRLPNLMSKKQDQSWFTCPECDDLVSQYHPDDETAAKALQVDRKILAQFRLRTPVARSMLLKSLRHFRRLHPGESVPPSAVFARLC